MFFFLGSFSFLTMYGSCIWFNPLTTKFLLVINFNQQFMVGITIDANKCQVKFFGRIINVWLNSLIALLLYLGNNSVQIVTISDLSSPWQ